MGLISFPQHGSLFLVLMLLCATFSSPACGYDELDPLGNITIRWDVVSENDDGSRDVKLWIVNNELYRHIEFPGWRLRWQWQNDEVIWNMIGAETTEQGNCSRFKGKLLPHCCDKEPVIVDLMPGTPYNKQFANCCRGGVLSSVLQHPVNSMAGFQMHIATANGSAPTMPLNFDLGVPGYTCGEPLKVPPTKFFEDQRRRSTQALETWNVTCSYSQFRASPVPTCCVSLSAFYNDTVVPCPKCTCACQAQAGTKCVKPGELPTVLKLHHNEVPKPVVQCTDHMCPIQVHWHVKQNYKQYWRVKITINNLNYVTNYSDWNLVVLHPNLENITQVFSFNYKPLNVYGNLNDTGLFYGRKYYNDMLLQSGESGNVQTEVLLGKDQGSFSFGQGWAFPRKISFNGEQCVMPLPENYPRLPNNAHIDAASVVVLVSSFLLLVVLLS